MSGVVVRWLGVNGLEFKTPGASFMIDPYVSRDPQRLSIDEEVDKYIASKPDFILMTHAHWDHLPDAPRIIARSGATLCASKTACNIMRSLGVPESRLHELSYGERLSFPGGVKVQALESRHKEPVVAPGCYGAPQPREIFSKRESWLCGEVFSFLIECEGLKIFNMGSANLHKPSMGGAECDFLFCGISRWTPGFPELLAESIRFRCLIPTHHDEFTLPLSEFRLREDMRRLMEVLPKLRPDAKYLEIPVLQWTKLPPDGGAL